MKLRFNPLRDIILVILLTSIIFYLLSTRNNNTDKKVLREYQTFNKADIKGRIDTLGYSTGLATFKVDNNEQTFHFSPNISAEGNFFRAQIEVGDSLIKPPYSSVVIIKSNDTVYQYTFKKYGKE